MRSVFYTIVFFSTVPFSLIGQIAEVFSSSETVSSASYHLATGNIDSDSALELIYVRDGDYLYIIDGESGEVEWEGGSVYSSIETGQNPIFDIGDGTLALAFRASFNGDYRACIYQNGSVTTSTAALGSSTYHLTTGNIDSDPASELVFVRDGDDLFIVDGASGQIEWEGGSAYSSIKVGSNPIYNTGNGTYALTFKANVNGANRICIYQNGSVVESVGTMNYAAYHLATGNIDLDPAPELVYVRDGDYLYIADGVTGQFDWEGGSEYNSITLGDNPIYNTGTGAGLLTFRASTDEGNRVISIGELPSQNTTSPILLPQKSEIYQNYPNPFNPTTNIKYSLPKDSFVKLLVYDVGGREVKALANKFHPAGNYSATWDGTNEQGVPVNSGMYISRLKVDGLEESIKMIFLK